MSGNGNDEKEVLRIIGIATAESPHLFAYAELLNCAAVQALRGSQNEPYLHLLNIFAFGTLQDYSLQREAMKLPSIGDDQTKKLRQLTVLTMATNNKVCGI